MPRRRGRDFAVSDMLDAYLTTGKEQKTCQRLGHALFLAG